MTFRRVARTLFIGIGFLVGAVVLLAIVLAARVEWQRRAADPAPRFVESAQPPTGTGPVLILLHGAGLNGRMWDPVRRHLDPAYRVIALDLPGHGARRGEVYTLEAAASLVGAAARSVAPSPVILVGDSLGGYTAMAAASSVPPSQLRGLVLAGSSSERDAAAALRYLSHLVLVAGMTPFFDMDARISARLGSLGVKEEADRRAMVAAGVNANSVPPAERAILNVDFRSKLAAVDAPVLIVNGSLDTRAVAGEDAYLAAARRGERYRFDNTEHGVSMRRSAEFAALVNRFAARAFAN